MTSTTTMALPTPVDASIFEKSSALNWERIVRGWLLGLLIAIGIGGSIWGFYQEIHKAVSYTHLDVYKRQAQYPGLSEHADTRPAGNIYPSQGRTV